jgi:hypothetical protein
MRLLQLLMHQQMWWPAQLLIQKSLIHLQRRQKVSGKHWGFGVVLSL